METKTFPETWRDRFFERYQESLRFGEVCEEGERELLALLDFKEVSVLILESSSRRKLYEMEEMAGECALRALYEAGRLFALQKVFS